MNSKEQSIINFNDANKLYKGNLYKEALEQYKKAVKYDPAFYDAHFCIAKCMLRLDNTDEALSYFNKYVGLIPKDKLGNYIFSLMTILKDSGHVRKALNLVKNFNVTFNEKQQLDYGILNLSYGDYNNALHTLLNYDKNKVNIFYDKVINDKSVSDEIKNKLNESKSVPLFFNAIKRIKTLKSVGINNKDLLNLISKAQEELIAIKESNPINISKLDNVYETIAEAQIVIDKQSELLIKTDNLSNVKPLISVLAQTGYNKIRVNELKKKADAINSAKRNKSLKVGGIAAAAVLILGLAGYFGYNAYAKSSAKNSAIQSNSIYALNNFISTYGKDTEIDKLREKKFYEIAVKSNDAKDFAGLSRNYPNSKFLRKIEVKFSGSNSVSRRSYGLGNTNQNTDVQGGKNLIFKAPIGSKVGYSLSAPNSVPMTREFTVTEDLVLNETIVPSKELVFSDSFKSNKYNWSTFNNSTVKYGKTKNKGVKISNGELQLFNELNENQFTYSSIYTSKISRKSDFEIETSITRNDNDRGSFIMFGMGNRAFNYFAINKSGNYQYGYNDWNSKNDNWVALSNGWKYSNAIKKGKYDTNTLKVTKTEDVFTLYINNDYIGTMPQKRWYGNRIGFGINDRTNIRINSVDIYKRKNRVKTNFVKDEVYYCWVDELNVRNNDTKKGQILTTIKLAEPVNFTGNVGKKIVNATFKGIYSPDYYYEVELVNGTKGWVHGGALKSLPSEEKIDFSKYQSKDMQTISSQTKTTDDSEFYMISVYAENSKTMVRSRVDELKQKGFSANYLWIPDYKSLSGAKMYAVYIGPFPTKETCKQKLSEAKKYYPKAYGLLASKNTTQRITVK